MQPVVFVPLRDVRRVVAPRPARSIPKRSTPERLPLLLPVVGVPVLALMPSAGASDRPARRPLAALRRRLGRGLIGLGTWILPAPQAAADGAKADRA